MNIEPVELSVVMPAYEEAVSLGLLLPELKRVLAKLEVTHEIVVVDAPAPRDATPEICRHHGVVYTTRSNGASYAHAIQTGQVVARGRFVVLMDADGSHNPEFIAELWRHREQADLIIASRYVRGGKTENPRILILMSLIVNYAFRIFLRLPCSDVSNSFRLYRGKELRALTLECEHFDVVEEILVKLFFSRPGYRLKEIPCTFERRKAGHTKRDLVAFAVGYCATLLRLYVLKRRVKTRLSFTR